MELKEDIETTFKQAKDFFFKQTFIIPDHRLRTIITAIKMGKPILAVGPTGSGKTHFFVLLSQFLKGSYDYVSLNGSVTIHDLTQERILDKDGSFKDRDMVLATWLRNAQGKNVSLLQLDEVNAARPETLIALHPIMDLKGELRLPYTNEVLKVTPNAVLVMSCNEGDEYAGVNAMNTAFQNRYIKVHFPYLENGVLAKVLQIKTGVSDTQAKAVVNVWEKYMASKEPEQPVVGIRVLETWCEMSKVLGLREAGVACFASLIANNEEELATISEGDFFVNLPE